MKYEYKILVPKMTGWLKAKVDEASIEKEINKFGFEGWELVSVVPMAENMGWSGKTASLVYYFKRPIN